MIHHIYYIISIHTTASISSNINNTLFIFVDDWEIAF